MSDAAETPEACWCSEDGIVPKVGHADDHVLGRKSDAARIREWLDSLGGWRYRLWKLAYSLRLTREPW